LTTQRVGAETKQSDRPSPVGSNPDPIDLLRAMLAINPEDAASAREDAAKAGERQKP